MTHRYSLTQKIIVKWQEDNYYDDDFKERKNMKNKVIKLTTKAAAVVTMAGIIVGTSSTVARADDGINENAYEETVYAELVPEAQCIDDFNKTEYICEDGYESVIHTELVPEAHVRIDDPEPVPEITYNDGTTVRAELVPEAQCIDDLNETEYKWVDGQGPTIIRTELVPEEAPVIVNGPCLYKELVPAANLIIGSAPENTESPANQENVTPSETQAVSPEQKPETEKVTLSKPETIPHYGDIKRCYFEKGPNVALCMFILYHPTPLGYDVIEYMEQTLKEGDRGYTIDGVYYDCPENDPYFKDKNILYSADAFKNFR